MFSSLFFATQTFALSLVDSLLKQEDYKKLSDYIDKAIVIEHYSQLPDNPVENQLLIIDNDYDVKILYEYSNGEWNEKGGEKIAQIINGGNKTSFHHLFNFKMEKEDFNDYTSDKENVTIEILKSSYKQDSLNRTIKGFIKQKNLEPSDIINIQVQNINEKTCDIIISYKY